MTGLFLLYLLWRPPAPLTLGEIRAETNAEHRARLAVDYAMLAERRAEAAYTGGDPQATDAELKEVRTSIEISAQAFVASRMTPGRNPMPYKYAEMHTHELLVRLSDLRLRMDPDQRDVIDSALTRVQEIHDAWFEGILAKAK